MSEEPDFVPMEFEIHECVPHLRSAVDMLARCISSFTPEAALVFSQRGLEINEFDNARIMGLSVKIPSHVFENMVVQGENSVGVDLEELGKFLSLFEKDEPVTFAIDDFCLGEDSLRMKVSTPSKSVTMRIFEGKSTLASESLKAIKEKIPFDSGFTICAGELLKSLKRVQKVGENMILQVQGKVGQAHLLVETDASSYGELLTTERAQGEAEASYDVGFPISVLKGLQKDIVIDIRFGNDLPVKMAFGIGPIDVEVLIAPRIEDW